MENFHVGGVVYHKATKQRCVVIEVNRDGTLKVRTEKDETKHYFPKELETEEEVDARNRNNLNWQEPEFDPYINETFFNLS